MLLLLIYSHGKKVTLFPYFFFLRKKFFYTKLFFFFNISTFSETFVQSLLHRMWAPNNTGILYCTVGAKIKKWKKSKSFFSWTFLTYHSKTLTLRDITLLKAMHSRINQGFFAQLCHWNTLTAIKNASKRQTKQCWIWKVKTIFLWGNF